jgi:hypothetical protein
VDDQKAVEALKLFAEINETVIGEMLSLKEELRAPDLEEQKKIWLPTVEKIRQSAKRVEVRTGGNFKLYQDTVVRVAEDFPQDLVERQRDTYIADLKKKGLKDQADFPVLFVQHVLQYRSGKSKDPEAWRDEILKLRNPAAQR